MALLFQRVIPIVCPQLMRLAALEVTHAYRGQTNKYKKNLNRQWPDWRTHDPDKAIEHIR